MEVSGRRQADSENWDTGIPCDPCMIDDVNENAKFYCTNCDEFLCDTCARSHRRNKASRQHQLLDRDEMPRKKMSNVQDKFCDKHDGKLIEYLCDKHGTFCCTLCVTLYHVQCGVKYIDDLATEFSSSQEYKSLLKQIQDTGKLLEEYKNKIQHDTVDVTNCFRQFQADIQVFRREINSKIDALEHELMEQAEQVKNENLKAIESVVTLNSKLLEDTSEISSTLGLIEKCRQNQQLFIFAKKARTRDKEYTDKARKMLQENTVLVQRYAFSRNENILNTLKSPCKLGLLEMESEGDRITDTREQTDVGLMKEDNHMVLDRRIKEESEEEQQSQTEEKKMKTDPFKQTKVKFKKDINMNHKTDTNGVSITGSVLVSNDLLAVADLGNYSIKVIDLRSDTITSYIKLDDRPWDITYMDPRTLVVTCNTNLVFLHYDGKLSKVRSVPTEPGCTGISYRKGKLFVTFAGASPSVKILNHEGKVLQTFKHNDEGQNMFSEPRYITLGSDGDTLYVTDVIQNTVTSLSMDGKVCDIYKHERLMRPTGLTLGDNESMYVAGYGSNNIHQISQTCKPARIVSARKDRLRYPRTVSYSNTDKTLYVSNRSSAMLHVYKLE